ncbi:MAG: hypothetical protein QOD58_1106 [Mycobacterium sp.]|nr:hypothetical protein [Mycobacterium sp.]
MAPTRTEKLGRSDPVSGLVSLPASVAPLLVVTSNSTERQAVTHQEATDATPSPRSQAEALKAVVRRNTEQVQGQGDFALFEELFDDDFVDHTPQPGTTPDKAGVRVLYNRLREAFPDFRPEIHWQTVDGDIVTTFKTYHGTHQGDFLGIAPSGKTIQFETVDAMRVRDGKITDHWGVANLYSVLQQLGQLPT